MDERYEGVCSQCMCACQWRVWSASVVCVSGLSSSSYDMYPPSHMTIDLLRLWSASVFKYLSLYLVLQVRL
jgi:hypothetical protein